VTRGEFMHKVLADLGIEKTLDAREAIAAWMQAEGGSADNNPLNTTLVLPGSTTMPGNTAGVQEYASADSGVEATVRTLREEGHGYAKIRRRLRFGAPAWAIVDAIIESDWGTGHEDKPGQDTVIEKVLDDIRHDRQPNRLRELETRAIAS
jgi:hypothetical protein